MSAKTEPHDINTRRRVLAIVLEVLADPYVICLPILFWVAMKIPSKSEYERCAYFLG